MQNDIVQVARALKHKGVKENQLSLWHLQEAIMNTSKHTYEQVRSAAAPICEIQHVKSVDSILRIWGTVRIFCFDMFHLQPDFQKPAPEAPKKPNIVQTLQCEEYWAFIKLMIREGNYVEKKAAYMLQFLMLTGYRVSAVEKLRSNNYCHKGVIAETPPGVVQFWLGVAKQGEKQFIRAFPVAQFNQMLEFLEIKDIEKLSQDPVHEKTQFFNITKTYMSYLMRQFQEKCTHPLAKRIKKFQAATLRKVFANFLIGDQVEKVENVRRVLAHSSRRVSLHYVNYHSTDQKLFAFYNEKAETLLSELDKLWNKKPKPAQIGQKRGRPPGRASKNMVPKEQSQSIAESPTKKRDIKALNKESKKQ